MYYIHMAQPKTAPKSFRPGDERWARIEAYAEKHRLSPHLTILTLLDAGLREPIHPGLAYQISEARKGLAEMEDRAPKALAARGLTREPVPYGSRLKQPKAKK